MFLFETVFFFVLSICVCRVWSLLSSWGGGTCTQHSFFFFNPFFLRTHLPPILNPLNSFSLLVLALFLLMFMTHSVDIHWDGAKCMITWTKVKAIRASMQWKRECTHSTILPSKMVNRVVIQYNTMLVSSTLVLRKVRLEVPNLRWSTTQGVKGIKNSRDQTCLPCMVTKTGLQHRNSLPQTWGDAGIRWAWVPFLLTGWWEDYVLCPASWWTESTGPAHAMLMKYWAADHYLPPLIHESINNQNDT